MKRIHRLSASVAAASVLTFGCGGDGSATSETKTERPASGDPAPPPTPAAPTAEPPGTNPPPAGTPPPSGSPAPGTNPELDRVCTPGFALQLQDTDAARRAIFTDAMGANPEAAVQAIGRDVCRILYRKPEEVRKATHLKLVITYAKGDVAWKSGDGADIEVGISTDHLANVKKGNRDVAKEIKGILYHEMTHMYQHDDSDGSGVDGGLIEGIADSVRIRSGYTPEGARPNKTGAWNDGYTATAFYLIWVESKHTDFIYRLNMTMDSTDGKRWSKETIRTITGKSAEELWTEYAAAP